jgi:hypothetical protein
LPNWDWEINLLDSASPDDPITLFTIYYTLEIMDQIVEYINECAREPVDNSLPYAQANDWYPTSWGELYIYFIMRIYMTLVVMNEISDYWNISNQTPDHLIINHISRNRFQELYIQV